MTTIGLLLALYNANTTTDWVTVASAASPDVPIRAIVPVPHVSPPDPGWIPTYPSPTEYRRGVSMLQAAGVEVYAYTHLRNLSEPCCTCCGNLTQFKSWVDTIKATAEFDGVMMDNNDAPFSAPHENPDGLLNMYVPAALYIQQSGLGVWTNGPHVSKNATVESSATAWHPYLTYSNFTTLFEMPVDVWTKDANAGINYSLQLNWPTSKLGGYVLDIPNDPNHAKEAIRASLELAVKRGLSWLYPTITCQHRTGSCTYADLPSYWDILIGVIEEMNKKTKRKEGLPLPLPPAIIPPRLPTWNSSAPNPTLPFGGYPLLRNTTPELIFAATTADGEYNHNVFLHYVPQSDKLFAYWKNGQKEEDTPGQRIMLSWRDADASAASTSKWSTPIIAFGNLTTPGRQTVMFAAPAITLPNGNCYIAASPGFYNQSLQPHVHVAQGAQCALWPDSMDTRNCGPAESYAVLYQSTLLLRRVYNNGTLGSMFWFQGPPSVFSAATLTYTIPTAAEMDEATQHDVVTIHRYPNTDTRPCGSDFTGTTKCEWCGGKCQLFSDISYDLGISNERSTFSTLDGADVLFYRASNVLFASTRLTRSSPWSAPMKTSIPNDASNLNTGRLSNGLRYLVHNPVPEQEATENNNGRDPLTLTTSSDGGWSWNNTHVIATCLRLPFGNCTPRFVHDVDKGPSYPQLIEIVQQNSDYKGTWVAFTNNKEDVWVVQL